MTKLKTPICVALLLAFGALLGGCSTRTSKETTIPWGRPQGWEGQIPGMGSMPGGGR
jgi:hypothetical protein